MSRPPRGLTADEAVLWANLARSVTPLKGRALPPQSLERDRPKAAAGGAGVAGVKQPPKRPSQPRPTPSVSHHSDAGRRAPSPPRVADDQGSLDSHWDRRLKSATTAPDFTLDLHGHTLEQAHNRLDMGLAQARAMGARLVLVVTGKPRPVDAADRGERRGAIRAKILDWLAAGPHASHIAAIRKAHRRHGGEGALYLVLKRER